MAIYLDHNATTPLLPAVVDGMLPFLREHFGNPSSGHEYGHRAREAVERARAQVADLFGCAPDEVIFTSGERRRTSSRSEASPNASEKRELVTSSIEHPATTHPF